MKVLVRGKPDFIEVPDLPTLPAGLPVARGSEASADTQLTLSYGVARADSTSAPLMLTTSDAALAVPATLSFARTDAPAQLLSVASAVADLQSASVMRGDLGGASDAHGGGEIARGSDTLASLTLDGPSYADHGWFVVPSASNEYGQAYAAANDFAFDVAAGEFSADWFWV